MPRDLFAETVGHRYAPKRSKWTIAGSILAHAGVAIALLVVPLVSALDDYVIRATDLTFNRPPDATPASPAPPPKTATPAPTNVNPNAAPPAPPTQPVTAEVTQPGPPGPPGMPPDIIGRPGDPTGVFDNRARVDLPPPPPVPPKPIHVGGDIKTPTRVYSVDPTYPSMALAVKQEGMVILEATIDESGNVRNVTVLRSIPLLDKAAVEAVSKWRYTPTKLNGVPIAVILTVTVTFSLR